MTTGAVIVPEGDDVEVTVALQATAWQLRAGHQLTLILCADGSPTFWPAPRDTEVFVRDVRLSIPTLGPAYRPEPVFAAPQTAPTRREKLKWIDPTHEPIAWPLRESAAAHSATTAAHHLSATGTDYFVTSRFELETLKDWQGWSAKSYRVAFERPGWSIRIDTRLEVTSTDDAFEIAWMIKARDGGSLIHRADKRATVPRATV
jgi:hypothetical protein